MHNRVLHATATGDRTHGQRGFPIKWPERWSDEASRVQTSPLHLDYDSMHEKVFEYSLVDWDWNSSV